jgi:hypothetical protein
MTVRVIPTCYLTLPSHFYCSQIETIFIIDCSGSMQGTRILNAREAMHVALHSLPANSRFNIIMFGDSDHAVFPGSTVELNNANLIAAGRAVDRMDAGMGGTEVWTPLFHATSSKCLTSFFHACFSIVLVCLRSFRCRPATADGAARRAHERR